jgi:hypothetical protein
VKRASIIGATVLAHAASPAHAFDSTCVPEGSSTLTQAICSSFDEDRVSCKEGLEAARGSQYGEHTFLTREAMLRAGLADFADDRTWFTYYGPDADSIEPTTTAAMEKAITRKISIPELAQVPDASASFSDYALGNEHCVLAGVADTTPEALDRCHHFTELGLVNSTHFWPQSRAVYDRFHGLALAIAARCKTMKDALAADPLAPMIEDTVAACEREALAYQAVASHFLEDAWSSGHMWERWGTPQVPQTTCERTAALTVGAIAGLIHGARSVVGRDLRWTHLPQHDQMCMPGPYSHHPEAEWRDTLPVEWGYPGGTDLHAGAGDDYLLACTARDNGWSLWGSPELNVQKQRMLTCLGKGFAEVYAAGPKTRGDLAWTGGVDPAIASSTQGECWNQRATNRSMYLGFGLSGLRGKLLPWLVGVAADSKEGGPIPEVVACVIPQSLQLRRELSLMAMRFERRAIHAPDDFDLANNDHALLGVEPNSMHVGELAGDQVPYLEPPDLTQWNGQAFATACATDADCASHGSDAYCPRATVEGSERRCMPGEAPLLHAFRSAETVTWCEQDTRASIELAMRGCHDGNGPDACDACVDVVIPHLRGARTETDYLVNAGQPAVCDGLATAGLVDGGGLDDTALYAPFDPADPESAKDAALCLCRHGAYPETPDEEITCGDISFGWSQGCQSRGDGLWCWGDGNIGPPGGEATRPTLVLPDTTRVSHGGNNTCAVKSDGTLWCWGMVQVGIESDADPDPVVLQSSSCPVQVGSGVREVASGVFRRCALTDDGELGCAGYYKYDGVNSYTTCGPFMTDSWYSQCTLTWPDFSAHHFIDVSVGRAHQCAVTDVGNVLCWGANASGQLGNGETQKHPGNVYVGSYEPVQVLSGAVKVEAGQEHTCALRGDGTVWCWGYGVFGSLGNGAGTSSTTPVPASIADVADISLNQTSLETVAVKRDGTVWKWGLENNNSTYYLSPVQVPGIENAVRAAAGQFTDCVTTSDGNAWCWGWNYLGGLGIGSPLTALGNTPQALYTLDPMLTSPDGSVCPAQSCGFECPAECGRFACQADETCETCPTDCGACPAVCGNAACETGEDCAACPGDCGACPGVCESVADPHWWIWDGCVNAVVAEGGDPCPGECPWWVEEIVLDACQTKGQVHCY